MAEIRLTSEYAVDVRLGPRLCKNTKFASLRLCIRSDIIVEDEMGL